MNQKAYNIRHVPTGKWLVAEKRKDEITAADIRNIREPLVISEADAIERISTLEHPGDWEIVERPASDLPYKQRQILEKFCSGKITKADAMTALNLHCVENLYAMIINTGFELPRMSREDALESGRAATNFIKGFNK